MTFQMDVERILNAPDRPELNKRPLYPEGDYQHIILIILDGVSRKVFESAEMPFIRSLQKKGAYYSNCYTSFPTMTASAHSSINSGSYPETHAVGMATGGERIVLDNSIYLSSSLKMAGLTSSCVADPTFKGAFSYLSVEYFGHSISRTGEMASWSFETFKPSFLTVTFYAADTLSHAYGPGHEHVYMALTEIDKEVEKFFDRVRQVGEIDKTLFVIASDHGQVGSDIPVISKCNAFGRLGIDFVPNPGGRTIILNNPSDKQLQQWSASEMTLRVLSPSEVHLLGHHCAPNRYVVCLHEGYTWQKNHNVSLHGGLSQEERNVPLVLSGYGVRPGVYEQIAEGIDIAPTVSALLGGVYLNSYQGRILSEALIWNDSISCDSLIDWRQRRETWIHASKQDAHFDVKELLFERRRLENEYLLAVLERLENS